MTGPSYADVHIMVIGCKRDHEARILAVRFISVLNEYSCTKFSTIHKCSILRIDALHTFVHYSITEARVRLDSLTTKFCV